MSGNIPRFISEKDLAEQRRRNEEEGIEEAPYDPRPLYNRLQVCIQHPRSKLEFKIELSSCSYSHS